MTDECEGCKFAGEKKPPGVIPIQSGVLLVDDIMYPCSINHYYVIAKNVKDCKQRQPKESGNTFLQRKIPKKTRFRALDDEKI